jgi:hypothetical protein
MFSRKLSGFGAAVDLSSVSPSFASIRVHSRLPLRLCVRFFFDPIRVHSRFLFVACRAVSFIALATEEGLGEDGSFVVLFCVPFDLRSALAKWVSSYPAIPTFLHRSGILRSICFTSFAYRQSKVWYCEGEPGKCRRTDFVTSSLVQYSLM